ncbi:MAG: DUF962 domain-containing protein [Flavobacteriales bacterium]|nr:DUF962 domain-containing protein [Flavobacteriales bacterium]
MRPIQSWFDEYGESHRNATNTAIHWVCVPVIYFCVVGLIASIPSPVLGTDGPRHLWSGVLMGIVVAVYYPRSKPIALGMFLFTLLCFLVALTVEKHAPWPLWSVCLVLFALAWVGQFIGHHIEGKKPSFLKDLAFLLVGPAWLMAKLYRRFGIRY